MEELRSILGYQEGIDALRQNLEYTSLELKTLRIVSDQERAKHKQEVKQLLSVLRLVSQERDEAKQKLQIYLNNTIILPSYPPQFIKPKANSSITESSNSYENSSPDYLFDQVSPSPDFDSANRIAFFNQQQDLRFDKLWKGKMLPKQGQLLQAVTEVGPLLDTLLVAGPLPKWRNPPPTPTPTQQFRTSLVSINKSSFDERNFGLMRSSQMCSASMLNFGGCFDSNLNLGDTKRQRFQ